MEDAVIVVQVSPDGKRLASVSLDHSYERICPNLSMQSSMFEFVPMLAKEK